MEILRKLALMGLGIISLSEEKLRELIKEMEEKGEVSREEGEELFKKVLAKAEEERKAMEEKVRGKVREALERMDIVIKEDLLRLERKVNSLERRVRELAKELKGGKEG